MGINGLGSGQRREQGSQGPARAKEREAEAQVEVEADGMGENPSGWIGFVMQAGHGLISTPPPKCRLQFWARWHHVPADCDMSDGTWSLLSVTAVHKAVTCSHSLCLVPPTPPLSSFLSSRVGMRELSRVHYQSLSISSAIDNVNPTKPALGSTERCCRFNQAGLLRNDRPLLLRFPKPVPVPVPVPALLLMPWSLLPLQMLCCIHWCVRGRVCVLARWLGCLCCSARISYRQPRQLISQQIPPKPDLQLLWPV